MQVNAAHHKLFQIRKKFKLFDGNSTIKINQELHSL